MAETIYIQLAENGNIRKWQREPFDGGTAYLSASIPAEIGELVERLEEFAKATVLPIEAENGERLDYTDSFLWLAASALRAISAELETVKGERDEAVNAATFHEHNWQQERDLKLAILDRARAAEAKLAGGEAVKVKPLEWRGPDFDGEYTAFSIDKRYTILKWSNNGGHWLGGVGGYFPTVESAQAAAQADHETRILNSLTHPAPTHNDGSGEAAKPRYIGTIAHLDHGKTALTAAVVNALRSQPASHTSGEVTEAMLRRAIKAYHDTPEYDHHRALKNALEAALRGDAS